MRAALFGLFVLPVASAAAVALANVPEGPSPGFEAQVQPIFDANCVACHQEGSAQAGLNPEQGQSYTAIVGAASTEAAGQLRVVPGDPAKSYLLAKIEGSHVKMGGSGERMPLGGELDPAAIAIIRDWITAGAACK